MTKHTLSPDVDDDKFCQIIQIESNGNPDARPPKGTAGGLGQFLRGTWDDTGKKHYPALVRKFGAAWTNMRLGKKTATLQLIMLARFTEDNVRALGKGWGPGELYLAHFLGIGDARNVMRADPSDRVERHVTPKAVENNPSILTGRTCAQVRAWAANAMANKWAKAGRPDWIAKWYDPAQAATYLGPALAPHVEDDIPEDVEPVKHDEDAAPPADPAVPGVRGDPDTWLIQSMLKEMHYPPGKLDGRWGGMTAEALAGFINDRNGHAINQMTPPGSSAQFEAVKAEVKAELAAAKAEGFKRPVSEERANPTTTKVDEVAPEAAPVRRNSQVGIWGTVSAALAAAYNTVSGYVGDIWSFFTDNEDKLPDTVKDPSWLWSMLSSVPTAVWFALAAALFGFVWYNSRSAVSKIIEDVKTGVRK
jgi:hypothetical protein